jgi:NAD-dependent DNA ligase
MENKYKETESMDFLKETISQYKKDKNQINLRDNILKYKEIQSKENIQKERDDKLNDFGFDFIKDLPVTFEERAEVVATGDDLVDMVVVYTGIRDKNSEEAIVSRGGKIGSGVSKNTTHLICKDPNSGSSKLEKAKSLGVVILTVEELEDLLK